MSWFANVGDTKEYQLPIGGWIRLRKELSVGERRRAFANAIKGQTEVEGGLTRTEYDHAKLTFGLVVAYLAEWSEKEEITQSAVEALRSDVYEQIEAAVNKHAEEFGGRPLKRQKDRKPKKDDGPISLSAA